MLEDPNLAAFIPRDETDRENAGPASDAQDSLMTPAKRAGLEALEREFADLLKKKPR